MATVDEIKAAISSLAYSERESIGAWLEELNGGALRIGESAAAYETAHELLSVEEYLEREAASPIRHEYVHGVLHAMCGVSRSHNRIACNLLAAFGACLRGSPCEPYMSDFKVRIEINQSDVFYYPDLMVACARDDVDKYFLRYPKLIVEILSPSTEQIDRREKRFNYRLIPTLEEYVLISQDAFELTSYARADNWTQHLTVGADAVFEFRSIGLTLPVSQIYERVDDIVEERSASSREPCLSTRQENNG